MSNYDWTLYPKAETFLQTKVTEFLSRNQFASDVASMIEEKTSARFFDWIDHMTVPVEEIEIDRLEEMGFRWSKETSDEKTVLRVPDSILFSVVLSRGKTVEVALCVDDLEKFRSVHSPNSHIEGERYAPLRKIDLSEERECKFSVVERNGSNSFEVEEAHDIPRYIEVCSNLEERQRKFESEEEGLSKTRNLLRNLASNASVERLASAFFRAERLYWEGRNAAARTQKGRQDELGLGWGNRDHHTFRSSRTNFKALIEIFEAIGLKPRERFHAGAQAGWGAQILEDNGGRNVVFADVDLDAQERGTDFAHQGLRPRPTLGTVGLWVGLHGESILQAGMHHMAARFRFEKVTEDLKLKGVAMMKPFSNFPFLKQAFTQAESWRPDPERNAVLVSKGLLIQEQAQRFAKEGTLGSHLENIQRGQGFKGFNQDSVSAIIRLTDPRRQTQMNFA